MRRGIWVTDFGLARLRSDSGLTVSGDLLGTLRYMSPEQALGKRVVIDGRTDIYSLGVTLYELVILEPVFEGRDRQEMLRRIAEEEPRSPRRLDASIPRELETILLKAMNKEPESRYETAQELADDLRRFLDDRPIRARRPTLTERAAKWARRHRAIVASGLMVAAVMVISLAIGSTLLARKQLEVARQRDRANESAEVANAQRALAEQNARLARQAVDEMFTQVAEKWLADEPGLERVQREFLEKALQYYEEFSRIKNPDPAARESVASALSRVGSVRLRMGMVKPAEEALRQALVIDQRLADETPSSLEYRYRVAWLWGVLGGLLLEDGRTSDAIDACRRSIAAAESLTNDAAGTPKYRQIRADAHNDLGRVFRRLNQFREAETEAGQATPVLEKLLAEDHHNENARDSLASNLNTVGTIFWATGRQKEAESAFRRSSDLRQIMFDASPRSRFRQDTLADSIANLGTVYCAMQDFRDAEKMYRRVLPLRRKIVDEFPAIGDYQTTLAQDLGNFAEILRKSGKPQEAEPLCRESAALLERLTREHPELHELRAALATSLRNLAFQLDRHGNKAEAELSSRRAMEILEPLIAESPEIPDHLFRFLEAAIVRSEALIALDRSREVEAVMRRALDLSSRLAARFSNQPEFAEGSLASCIALGSFLRAEGHLVEARDILRRGLGQGEALAGRFPERPESRKVSAQVSSELSRAFCLAPQMHDRDFPEAIDLAAKAVALQPESGEYLALLAEAHYRVGDLQAADKVAREATLSDPRNVRAWFLLTMTECRRGDQAKARKNYAEALRLMHSRQSPHALDEADDLASLVDRWVMNQSPSHDHQIRKLDAEAAATLGKSD
jgi:tetratricopeptide (TPR) repeat protein